MMQTVESNSVTNDIGVLQGTTQSQSNLVYQEHSSGPPSQGLTDYQSNSDSQNQHAMPSSVQQQSLQAPIPQKQQPDILQPQHLQMVNPAPPPPSTPLQSSAPTISGPIQQQQQQNSTSAQDQRQVRCGACESAISDSDHVMQCQVGCRQVFHRPCTQLTEDAWNHLMRHMCQEVPQATWICDRCSESGRVPPLVPASVICPVGADPNRR